MAFHNFSGQSQGVQLLQRSLARGRLGHAYLFTGDSLTELVRDVDLLANLVRSLEADAVDVLREAVWVGSALEMDDDSRQQAPRLAVTSCSAS
jgi:hypothetical protein